MTGLQCLACNVFHYPAGWLRVLADRLDGLGFRVAKRLQQFDGSVASSSEESTDGT